MSFSTELKEEISKSEKLSNKENVKYELMGYLMSSNISEEKNKIKKIYITKMCGLWDRYR